MALELINNHLISVQQEIRVKAKFFFMQQSQQTNFEMMVK
jgi:hypothetical protein